MLNPSKNESPWWRYHSIVFNFAIIEKFFQVTNCMWSIATNFSGNLPCVKFPWIRNAEILQCVNCCPMYFTWRNPYNICASVNPALIQIFYDVTFRNQNTRSFKLLLSILISNLWLSSIGRQIAWECPLQPAAEISCLGGPITDPGLCVLFLNEESTGKNRSFRHGEISTKKILMHKAYILCNDTSGSHWSTIKLPCA